MPRKRRGTSGEYVFLRRVTIDFTSITWSFILEVCKPVKQSAITKSLKDFREGTVSTAKMHIRNSLGFPTKRPEL